MPVEALRIDDRVRLARSSDVTPIVWVGHRTVDCTLHPKPHTVWPVRICAGAFGPGLPSRDLWLSPDHAVFVDDVLIPVKYLINGEALPSGATRGTIVQHPVDKVTYYHIELPAHDILLAEGLPAESLLDTGDRSIFTNGATGSAALSR